MVMVATMAIVSHAQHQSRITDGTGLSLRRIEYNRKMVAILDHENPVLYAGDFLQYLLDRNHLPSDDFDTLIGREKDYFRSDVFNTAHNDGSRPLPKFLQEVMAALTNTPSAFWLKTNFHANEAEVMTIHLETDIQPIIQRHKNDGGRETKARRRDQDLTIKLSQLRNGSSLA